MVTDNITAAYGEWLYNHINYYEFKGKTAQDLRRKLMAVDVMSAESDRLLIEYYREFVSLFVNNMFLVTFNPPTEGIITRHIKAYLVKNDYGVMAPIEFVEESHMEAKYDLDSFAAAFLANSKTDKPVKTSDYASVREKVEQYAGWDKKTVASRFRAIFAMVLVAIGFKHYMERYAEWGMIEPNAINMVILLILVIAFFKAFFEFFAGMRRKRFMKDYKICEEAVSTKSNEAKTTQKESLNAQLVEYKKVLAEALVSNNPSELPAVGRRQETKENNIDKEVKRLQKYVEKPKKMQRKVGKFITFLLVVTIVYLTVGADLLEGMESGNYDTSEYDTSEEVEMQIAVIGGTTASSALTSSKTGVTYDTDFTIDHDWSTCWQDGVASDGTGEWLAYGFDKVYNLVGISIVNGRVNSEDKYYENGRIQNAKIVCYLNNEVVSEQYITFSDEFNTEQFIRFDVSDSIQCDSAHIVIESVYPGSMYDDLCLTEVTFFSEYVED